MPNTKHRDMQLEALCLNLQSLMHCLVAAAPTPHLIPSIIQGVCVVCVWAIF